MAIAQSRRRFLTNVAFAGAAGLGGTAVVGLGNGRKSIAAEPPPETTTLRLAEWPVTCGAQQWVAPELLYAEGFTDVEYYTWGQKTQHWPPEVLLSGEADISVSFIPTDLIGIDAGEPLVWLAGSHIGCVELVAGEWIRSTRDLKGRTVGLGWRGGPDHIFTAMFAAYVGLDPQKDINWIVVPDMRERMQQLADGKIDALMWGPPTSLEMRGKIGHVLVNTTTDKPWSQYFCCMWSSTRAFVGQHPVATKRALRALLKAADICALEPERVARLILARDASKGYEWQYDTLLQGLKEIPYGQWREYDPTDSVRWHALWMGEVGMIKNTPQKIIAEHADWRFFNELKHELKA
jgi:NitT/TauT family transport system substrate-binding protein